jgi:hypothetical protein
MTRAQVGAFLLREFREVVPPTLFFAGGFALIELTTQLILDDYFVRFANFMVAIGAALIVGKAVLIANKLPFLRRFDTAPLFRPILFKSVVYSLAVLIARILEGFIEYLFDGGTFAGFPGYLVSRFSWHRFTAVQLWIFVLFVIYTGLAELNARLGHGELTSIVFTRHATHTRRHH